MTPSPPAEPNHSSGTDDRLRRPGDRLTTVFVVDDNPTYLDVVGAVVGATPGFRLVGTATTVAGATEGIGGLRPPPDLVLIDVNLGEGSGIDVARAVTADRPAMRVLLVSTLTRDDLPDDAPESGAAGYLPKVALGPAALRAAMVGAYDWAA